MKQKSNEKSNGMKNENEMKNDTKLFIYFIFQF
jgi:hypothetical protein